METTHFSKFKTTKVQFEFQDPKNWCLLHALLVYSQIRVCARVYALILVCARKQAH